MYVNVLKKLIQSDQIGHVYIRVLIINQTFQSNTYSNWKKFSMINFWIRFKPKSLGCLNFQVKFELTYRFEINLN